MDIRQVREQKIGGFEVRRYVFRHAYWYNQLVRMMKQLEFKEGDSRIPIDPPMEEGGSRC